MIGKQAKQISCDGGCASPVIFKTVEIAAFDRVTMDICGLGYYELFVNGKRVGEEYYKPVFSDYRARDFSSLLYPTNDTTSHSIYYNTHDITAYLHKGDNVFAVMLGNGFYRQKERTAEGKVDFGENLTAIFDIRIWDGANTTHVYSDGSETYTQGFIISNNLFYGETHDYAQFDLDTLQKGLKSGKKVRKENRFDTVFRKQKCPSDKVIRMITPQKIYESGDFAVYDVGENISGFVCFDAGQSENIVIEHAEEYDGENKRLDFSSCGGEEQISRMEYRNVTCGQRDIHPYFAWSGFRYFTVKGRAENVRAAVVHTAVRQTFTFECGNETLNWLYKAFARTMLSNMHGGVPSDCPHRERLGYTGDGQLTAETAMLFFDAKTFYEKWMQDIADCQDVKSGHVQHTAPFCGGGGGPGGWGCAAVFVPYYYYKTYGDKKIIRKYLPNMMAYLRSMQSFCENDLIVKEYEGGWCLGEWCTPDEVQLDEAFVNTCYYIKAMEYAELMAKEIGAEIDYTREKTLCRSALTQKYYDESTHDFCGGVQGANAFALFAGLGDDRTEENLWHCYETRGRFDTGIFGTDLLAQAAVQRGRIDLLYKLLTSDGYPSFAYWKENGATTLWERWDGASHSHPMFGGCVKQFVFGILGISGDYGYKHIRIAPPKNIREIGYVNAQIRLGGTTVKLRYEYRNGEISVVVQAKGKGEVTVCCGNGTEIPVHGNFCTKIKP